MKLWKLLVWFIIAAGLGLYIYFVERPAEDRKSAEEKPLAMVGKQAFSDLTFDRKGAAEYTLENSSVTAEDSVISGDKWLVKGIGGSTLDTPALSSLINEIKNFKIQNELPKEELEGDLGVYGLKEPELTLAISRTGTEKPFTIHFGKRSDFLTKRYVEVDDGSRRGIYLTDEALFTNANKEVFEFRNKTPILIPSASVKTIELNSADGTVALSKVVSDGSWHIDAPIAARASEKTIQTMIATLSGLRASGFIDGDAKAPLQPMFGASPVHLTFNKGTPEEKQVVSVTKASAGEESEYYLTVSGLDSIIKLPSDPNKNFVKPVVDFREKQYFNIDPYQTTAVDVIKGAERLSLKKDKENWVVNDKKGDQAFVQDYLISTSALPVVGYATGNSESAFANPLLVLTAKSASDEIGKTLTIGMPNPADDSQFFAKVSGIDEVFFTSSSAVVGLFPAAEKLIEVMPQITPSAP